MTEFKLEEIFLQFVNLLKERFSKKIYTTEDSVRYTLFYCLTYFGGIKPSDIVLEYPHTKISGAKIDIYILPNNDHPGVAFEFKFDRGIPSGRHTPRTQKAGKIFADIFRLAHFKENENTQYYFVYVADKEMANYFQNPSNKLIDFFNLNLGNEIKIDKNYMANHSSTFTKSSGEKVVDCKIICYLNEEINNKYWVRIYRIELLN
ncbi:MAG: hypothetical protein M1371_04135 [Actinobacteria bacterium]|nr:hypothetical protein [Actinomycetota bacterium]